MKETTLKSRGRKKERYALKAFLWGVIIASVFVIPSMAVSNGMYLYFGDHNVQVIPFYQHMVDSIHSGNWGWSWNTDLGSSFIGSYSFYNLGSPFFWILVLFPSSWVPYLIGPLTVLRLGLASFTAYIFLRRYVKNKSNAVMGAMLYAFSGASIYNLVFHFHDAMVIFPLLLASLDAYIFEDKRGRFAAVVALAAVTNYYLFIGEAVFCLIYWFVRMITKSFKLDARRVFYLIFEAVIGTGLAAFILLPSIYHVIGNNRMSESAMTGWGFWSYESGLVYINTIVSFFMPPEYPGLSIYVQNYPHTWSSITGYLPLFGMSGVFAIIFNKNRNKWIRVFYGVCALFMFTPVLNSTFQMFTDYKYLRWFFMLLLVMSLGSVLALEDPGTKWKKAIAANLSVTAALVLIMAFTPTEVNLEYTTATELGVSNNGSDLWVLSASAILSIAICVLFVSLYNRNKTAFKRYCALIVSLAILSAAAPTFVKNKVQGYRNQDLIGNGFINNDLSDLGIDDIDQWRCDIVSTNTYSHYMYDDDNLGQFHTPDYANVINDNQDFISTTMGSSDADPFHDCNNGVFMWGLQPFGIFHSTISSSITQFYKGMGFSRGTVSNLDLGMYAARTLLNTKYIFCSEDLVLPMTDSNDTPLMPGYKHLKKWGKYDIYENEYAIPKATTFDKFMLDTDFEKIPTYYRHLVLVDTLIIDSFDQMYEMTSMNMKQTVAEDYDFTSESYLRSCTERINAAAKDFTRDSDGFEFTIDAGSDDEYVFVSVPYDAGWSAAVNGKKAEIKKVDFAFMAVKVPAGQTSKVRFNFHTQGTLYGLFIAIVCGVMLLLYLAVIKMRKNAERAANEKPQSPEPDDPGPGGGKGGKDGGGDTPDDPGSKEGGDKKAPQENVGSENAEQEDFYDMSVFDIIKQTEEEHMMHVYKRVPVVLERGTGAVGYDIDDKKYIDFTSGIGVNALGYADGRWVDAVIKQLRTIQHTSNLYYNTTQIQLAELLCMKTGFSKVFFANSGAEANECAIKIARKYGSDTVGEKHTHIIALENSFHGRTITTLSATGQDVFHKHFQPFTEGFSFAKANDMESVKAATTEDTCAVMIELIQGEGGVNPLDKQFVTDLAAYCKEKGLLLIVDEIQTGVGRTGKLYCYENYGIQPDVITSAKALSGGLPLSACMCSDALKDVLSPGTNGTTFGGNPIACAGALKILEIVADDKFLEEVREKGEYFKERIEKMDGVKEVRGMGLMIGIVLEKDNASDVLAKCAENGLLVLTAKNLVRLLPPLSIEQSEIDEGLDILEKSIAECM